LLTHPRPRAIVARPLSRARRVGGVLMKCPRCQQENPPKAKFCLGCGAPLDATAAIGGFYAQLQVENERLRRAVAEASEQQAATSEILHVIADSPTDLQAVLDAVAASAARLCDSVDAQIFASME
jgi:two-component system, NtrC family, sensor kinase